MILEGTTSSGAVVPVQVTDDGKVVAEGLQGPVGPEGPEGPPGPPGGFWDRTGTVVSPTNAGDTIATADGAVSLSPGTTGSPLVRDSNGRIGVGTATPGTDLQIFKGTYPSFGLSDTAGRVNQLAINSDPGNPKAVFSSDSPWVWQSTTGTELVRVSPSGQFILGNVAAPAVSLDPGTTNGPLVRDSSGRLLVGTASSTVNCRAVFQGRSDNALVSADIYLQRGQELPTGGGAPFGRFFFANNQGAQAAVVEGASDGAWSGTSHPGRLSFYTTPSDSTTPVERMTIDSQGDVIFQGAPIIKSPDGKHWAIEVDNTGNLSAVEVL